jgi:hypothetical protein
MFYEKQKILICADVYLDLYDYLKKSISYMKECKPRMSEFSSQYINFNYLNNSQFSCVLSYVTFFLSAKLTIFTEY